ncbi:MAG: Transcriptional regulator, Crp/Fnr family [Candidatus Shapirobacteria bacterium GW2011_GWE1_38_10]|uniref:Transcriptional regulator, Crp/Fnr family n=1 Tax=Candidatus Shapirobacteria bacterium GW2011_GWE1_38_10 TaxID=1618488 RepID=A0A0G0KM31_9BACT|nr:MAG: Transcriptional regulator, Crp/Fnr family [Candidatus Shapirobacteria bacterium GW2011_GWE1_38_10]
MKEETKKKLVEFFSKFPLKKYKKGQVIFEPNDDFGGVYFVKSGYLRVYDVNKEGKESGIQLFKPLYFLSLIGTKTGIKNRHYIEALTPVEAWVVPKEEFEKFTQNDPKLYVEVCGALMEKFLDLTSYISHLVSGDAYTKVAGLIYSLASEYGVAKNKEVMIKFKITHKLIASLTGLTRETVTLQMLKLEKDGLIDNFRRQIVVMDMKVLKKALGYE